MKKVSDQLRESYLVPLSFLNVVKNFVTGIVMKSEFTSILEKQALSAEDLGVLRDVIREIRASTIYPE